MESLKGDNLELLFLFSLLDEEELMDNMFDKDIEATNEVSSGFFHKMYYVYT